MTAADSPHKKDKNLKSLETNSLNTSKKSVKKKAMKSKKPLASLKNIQEQLNEFIIQREDEVKLIAELQLQLKNTRKQVDSNQTQLTNTIDKKEFKKLKVKFKQSKAEFSKNTQTLSQEILIFKSLTHRIQSKIKLLEKETIDKYSASSLQENTALVEKINQFETQLQQFHTQSESLNQTLFEKIITQTDKNINSALAEQASLLESESDKKYAQINKNLNEHLQVLLAEKVSILEGTQQNLLSSLTEKHEQHNVQLSHTLTSLEALNSKQENLSENISSIDSRQHDLEKYQRDMELQQDERDKHQRDIEMHHSSDLNQFKNQFTQRSQIFLIGLLSVFIISAIILVKNNSNHQSSQVSLIAQLKTEISQKINQDTDLKLTTISQQNDTKFNLKLKQIENTLQKIKYETKREQLTLQSQHEVIKQSLLELSTKLNSTAEKMLVKDDAIKTPAIADQSNTHKISKKEAAAAEKTPAKQQLKPQIVQKNSMTKTLKDTKLVLNLQDSKRPFYGIQLLGARKQRTIEKFIKKYQLSEQAGIHQKLHQGKPWFILIYGQYASSKEAIKALKQLPQILQSNKPWVKKFP